MWIPKLLLGLPWADTRSLCHDPTWIFLSQGIGIGLPFHFLQRLMANLNIWTPIKKKVTLLARLHVLWKIAGSPFLRPLFPTCIAIIRLLSSILLSNGLLHSSPTTKSPSKLLLDYSHKKKKVTASVLILKSFETSLLKIIFQLLLSFCFMVSTPSKLPNFGFWGSVVRFKSEAGWVVLPNVIF